jgi:hypothetical protein
VDAPISLSLKGKSTLSTSPLLFETLLFEERKRRRIKEQAEGNGGKSQKRSGCGEVDYGRWTSAQTAQLLA